MRWLFASVLCGLLTATTGAVAGDQPRRFGAQVDLEATDRIIVKFRSSNAAAAPSDASRVNALAQRSGRALLLTRSVAPLMHSVRVERVLTGPEARQLAAQLALDPAVEYAVPDRRRFAQAAAMDPLYGTGDGSMTPSGFSGPIAQQWYLTPPTSTLVSAINAEQAWDLSNGTGSANAPVAVIDTGVLFDHPDLGRVVNGGKLLAGYDFIAADSDGSFSTANDSNGRDGDPSDPGDWISSSDQRNSVFRGCDITESSWHGTHIAGIIGAQANNNAGGTGIGWNTPVLPLRVLGKCAGYDSDILAAMRWAAGLALSNVPGNPNEVRILNLSLGAPSDSCSASYQDVISELTGRGVLVVAAGGNQTGPVHEPARCNGVVAVGGLRHNGAKVGFSSFGAQVGVSAPGGNCINLSGACLRPIVSASNTGSTSPSTMGYASNVGTSFSAPMAAGVAALMLGRNSSLTLDQLRDRLTRSARQFPLDLTLLGCGASGFRQDDDGEYPNGGSCNCTPSTCGAGMLDARRAVQSVLNALAVISKSGLATTGTNQQIALSGAQSLPAPGATQIATYAWTTVSHPGTPPTLGESNTQNATFTASVEGAYVVRLTVTDNGAPATSDAVDYTILVANPAPPTILSNPENIEVDAGDDAVFSVTATGVLITGYQWERSDSFGATFEDIDGATNSTYTLRNVSVFDDGAKFRVRVSTDSGTVTSASGRLTVDAGIPLPPKPGGGGALGWASLLLAGLALSMRCKYDAKRFS